MKNKKKKERKKLRPKYIIQRENNKSALESYLERIWIKVILVSRTVLIITLETASTRNDLT